MKRHSVIARLGADDRVAVSPAVIDSVVTEINFVDSYHRLEYGLGHALEQLHALALKPSEVGVDLAILAALVYAADTRIVRASDAQDGWTREIDLYVPVSNPGLWQNQAARLQDMLRFLTGDRWRFSFRERIRRHRTFVQPPAELRLEQFTHLCLFSGGLDSFIGAIDLLVAKKKPLLISHYWDSETSAAQQYCLGLLEKKFDGNAPKIMRVRTGFTYGDFDDSTAERTQRGRSFLFFALAALPASAFTESVPIVVPENGLIALNVPLDTLRVGALSTRTTHPYYIASWTALLRELGIKSELTNPYRHRTKGEMASRCGDVKFLKKTAANTMSCSSPAKARWNKTAPMHCGFCVPCLIRRAALIAAFGKDDTEYTIEDLAADELNSAKARGEHVRAFQVAIARLEEPSMARFLIHKPGPLPGDANELTKYARVYRRGMAEVGKLLDGVTTRPL